MALPSTDAAENMKRKRKVVVVVPEDANQRQIFQMVIRQKRLWNRIF
jgi:hypothetical protein